MKVGWLTSSGELSVTEEPAPVAGPGEVLVQLAACGICGTDLEKVRGRYRTAHGILGHEAVGRIASLGSDVSGFAEGDRVFAHHHVPCYNCPVCARGAYTFCPEYGKTNLDPGGFADYFRVPRVNVERRALLSLDPAVSWDAGTLLEPAACAFTALRRVGFRTGDSIFLLGLGPVGLLYARLARALGAGWIGGTELAELRRTAAELGGVATYDPRDEAAVLEAVRSATHGAGVDLAVVATGAPAAIHLGEKIARRGGTLNLFGLPEPGSQLATDLQQLYLYGVEVVPTYATTEPDIAEVHRLMADGKLPLGDLVTDHFALDQLSMAFAKASRPTEAVKVVVTGDAFR
ncbi:MAG: alcohol dehydrogenase catalytic domain-containing protein [Thermoplasmata archaeon]